MDRRQFIASLIALPFAAKLPPLPIPEEAASSVWVYRKHAVLLPSSTFSLTITYGRQARAPDELLVMGEDGIEPASLMGTTVTLLGYFKDPIDAS